MATNIDKKKQEFLALVASIGVPVIRTLLLETIDLIKNKSKKNELKQILDIILPACPISARSIKFNNKQYYMVFKPCPDVSKYNIIDEVNKIRNQLEENKHEYLMKEVGMTLSVIPNIYEKVMEDNPEFEKKLIDALPEGRKNIITNLIEHATSTVCMYDDMSRFALFIETEAD